MPSSVFANAVTMPSKKKSKKRMRSTSAWHLECWWCQKHLSERDETTVYSELFGNQQVHRCCSGPAQDHMDDEFNKHDELKREPQDGVETNPNEPY